MGKWKYGIVEVGNVKVIQAKDVLTGGGFTVSHGEIRQLLDGKITLASFPLPRSEYARFMRCVCTVADVPYKPELVERVTPMQLGELIVEIPELKEWDKYEREAKRFEMRKGQVDALIESLEKVAELMKKK